MKRFAFIFSLLVISLLSFTACVREDKYDNTPEGNFNQLWKIIDEHYCYLDYKKINWDSIGNMYRERLTPDMTNEQLFEVMYAMLNTLQDGHVNLSASHDQSRYDFWEVSPRNFSETIIEGDRYLGKNYRQASGIKYKILDDNIGYIYYPAFTYALGDGNLDEALSYLAVCSGLIIDVRQNPGGDMTNATKLAARFTNEKVLTGYISHKTGKGHSDFSEPYPIYLEPSSGVRWEKNVVVLCNKHTFSAANDFVSQMRYLPKVTIMGDTTGGGAGMPFTSELPNGWTIRFSASPMYDKDMKHTEWGIDPDVKVSMSLTEAGEGIDTIIETARELLTELYQKEGSS